MQDYLDFEIQAFMSGWVSLFIMTFIKISKWSYFIQYPPVKWLYNDSLETA